MKKKVRSATRKKSYEKPRLKVIELATEEVLGTGCWSQTSQIEMPTCTVSGCKL